MSENISVVFSYPVPGDLLWSPRKLVHLKTVSSRGATNLSEPCLHTWKVGLVGKMGTTWWSSEADRACIEPTPVGGSHFCDATPGRLAVKLPGRIVPPERTPWVWPLLGLWTIPALSTTFPKAMLVSPFLRILQWLLESAHPVAFSCKRVLPKTRIPLRTINALIAVTGQPLS